MFELSAIHFEFSAIPFEFSANSVWVFRHLFLSFRNQHSNFPLTLLSFLPSKFEGKGEIHISGQIIPVEEYCTKRNYYRNIRQDLEMTSMIQKFRIRSTWFGGEKQLNKFFRKRRQHMELSTVPHNVERNGRWEEEGKKKFTHSVKLW